MCIEHAGRIGWHYDQELWSSLESRLKKGEKEMDLQAELCKVWEQKKVNLRQRLEKERETKDKTKTTAQAKADAKRKEDKRQNQPNGPSPSTYDVKNAMQSFLKGIGKSYGKLGKQNDIGKGKGSGNSQYGRGKDTKDTRDSNNGGKSSTRR